MNILLTNKHLKHDDINDSVYQTTANKNNEFYLNINAISKEKDTELFIKLNFARKKMNMIKYHQ